MNVWKVFLIDGKVLTITPKAFPVKFVVEDGVLVIKDGSTVSGLIAAGQWQMVTVEPPI